jgi:cellulose biosynthesis protein BcsQ
VVPNSILVWNGKGGVIKTSLTANLAGIAAAGGWRVLTIDLDPQGNLARDLGYLDAADQGEALANAVRSGTRLDPMPAVRPNLDALAGGPALNDLVADLQRQLLGGDVSAAGGLAWAIAPIASEYDVVLMDSPPTEALLHAAAARAAHYVLIPTQPDAASIDGIGAVASVVARERDANPHLEVLGVVLGPIPGLAAWVQDPDGVPTKAHDRSAIERDARTELRQLLPGDIRVFDVAIRDAKKVAVDCRQRGELVIDYELAAIAAEPWWKHRRSDTRPAETFSAAASNLATDYQMLANEVFGRFIERQAASLASQPGRA